MKDLINSDVRYITDYFKNKGSFQSEEVRRAITLFDSLIFEGNDPAERYHQAYIMCRYMQPDSEELITLLFAPAKAHGEPILELFRKTFDKDRFKKLATLVSDCVNESKNNKILSGTAAYDYNAMIAVCDHALNRILATMSRHSVPDTECVAKAYRFAREAHAEVLRKSGEPYLNHPVAVAMILAEVGVESAVIAAALLHDVIEDTDHTHEDISKCCGEQVAMHVDAVTSVHKEYANSHKPNEYSIDKTELDKMSFEKLVRYVDSDRHMIFALYIKAADRLHNLSTIDIMSGEKKHNKIDETEYDYLPLFKRFGLTYFVDRINDQTWRTVNPALYREFRQGYEEMYSQNSEDITSFKTILDIRLKSDANYICTDSYGIEAFEYTVNIRKYLPCEVYKTVKQSAKGREISASMIGKHLIPVCDFDIILDTIDLRGTIDKFAEIFVKMFLRCFDPMGYIISDFSKDRYNRFIVSVKDKHSNTIRLCFALRKDYLTYNFGDLKGIPIEGNNYTPYVGDNMIHINLRNGKRCMLPKGATALDAAFAIHPDIGMTAREAMINGEKVSIYNMLHDGDQIEIFADTERKNGERVKYIPHVRIAWLEYVVTKDAKHQIVKTLENIYGDADPADAHKAQDEVVMRVAAMITNELTKEAENE